ncbi:MAG TPA: hypothetical protein PK978_05640 [Paludibacter sp.]|nr:hypothetical protein [Paludibacter sp.]HPM10022.1 hypothetical protein [Paludibacter sp.]
MEKLTISEKSELTQKLIDGRFFYEDLELFKSKFPYSKLNTELAYVNAYNQDRLHGQIIYNLLDEVSEKEIKSNRKKKADELKAAAEAEEKAKKEAELKAAAEAEKQDEANTETEETQEAETQVDATEETEETQQAEVQETETQKPAPVEKKTTQKGQSKKNSQK